MTKTPSLNKDHVIDASQWKQSLSNLLGGAKNLNNDHMKNDKTKSNIQLQLMRVQKEL